jgi:hypothetical protein
MMDKSGYARPPGTYVASLTCLPAVNEVTSRGESAPRTDERRTRDDDICSPTTKVFGSPADYFRCLFELGRDNAFTRELMHAMY